MIFIGQQMVGDSDFSHGSSHQTAALMIRLQHSRDRSAMMFQPEFSLLPVSSSDIVVPTKRSFHSCPHVSLLPAVVGSSAHGFCANCWNAVSGPLWSILSQRRSDGGRSSKVGQEKSFWQTAHCWNAISCRDAFSSMASRTLFTLPHC
jgi:hypothetical protein